MIKILKGVSELDYPTSKKGSLFEAVARAFKDLGVEERDIVTIQLLCSPASFEGEVRGLKKERQAMNDLPAQDPESDAKRSTILKAITECRESRKGDAPIKIVLSNEKIATEA